MVLNMHAHTAQLADLSAKIETVQENDLCEGWCRC